MLSLFSDESNLERWIGLAIAVPAMILALVARYQLGKSFSVTPQARELVTRGLYSKIKNPLYVFGSVVILGLLLILQIQMRDIFAIVAILGLIQIVRARHEAKVLEEKFGDLYREYRDGTWF
jgi:protein-S-isoprenylcysteine O-methyltransferase Ste14